MVTTEGNMANLKNSKTRVTVEYSVKFTGTKHDKRKGYQKHDDNLHRVALSNSSVILGVHKYIFSVTRALQKGFQIMSEVEALILKKHLTTIHFDEKRANTGGEGFLLTTKF